MDVQDQRPAAQLRGVFRTVVLEATVHQDSTDTKSSVHHLWPKGPRPSKAPGPRKTGVTETEVV
eukprot:11639333-Prorocentrum_lima.AAC.1